MKKDTCAFGTVFLTLRADSRAGQSSRKVRLP